MSNVARLGILQTADCFGERRIKRALPPEHRIVAIRDDPPSRRRYYLIEGPTLPESDETTEVVLNMTMNIEDGMFVLYGSWWHADETRWRVGQWNSMEAFRTEMESLDA